MSQAVRRLGMFGGAFDPPHRAHVALAQAAVGQLQLDQLRIFPTGNAWHKSRALTPAEHRLAMARLAFAAIPEADVDDREIRRDGPTYTVETLRELHAEFPQAELFLVMGEDQARAFTGWRDWQAIAGLATLAVAHRHDDAAATEPAFGLPAQARVRPLQLPLMPDSATGIRTRLTAGQDAGTLLPAGVAGYIAAHYLYQPT
ncbi:MAG: nicotinate (nicotinamide) nucleotide adenylyltransferase [Pseudomonadota bacterium]